MLAHIDYWRSAPVWDVASIQQATRTWFAFLGTGSRNDDHEQTSEATYERKIKTREELREAIGRGRERSASSCATALSTSSIPGTSATFSSPRARRRPRHQPHRRHPHQEGQLPPFVPRRSEP